MGFDLYWGDPVSTGGSPITGFVVQAYDYDTGSWFTFGNVTPTWQRDVFIDAPGEGCGKFPIAATNAAGVGPYRGPVDRLLPVEPARPVCVRKYDPSGRTS